MLLLNTHVRWRYYAASFQASIVASAIVVSVMALPSASQNKPLAHFMDSKPLHAKTITLAEFLPTCKWTSSNGSNKDVFVSKSGQGPYPQAYHHHAVSTEKCQVQDWVVFRVGPYITSGGNDWNNIDGYIRELPYSRTTVTQRSEYQLQAFTAAFFGNIDDYGRPIPFPPIHLHHFHVFPQGWGHWLDLQSHGDGQCHSDHGGMDCLIRQAPQGSAFYTYAPIGFFSTFNDVRAKYSVPLSSWVALAFKMVDPLEKRMQYRTFGDPTVLPHPCLNTVEHYQMCSYGTNGCCMRTDTPSYAWSAIDTSAWPTRDQVDNVDILGHGHGDAIEEVILFLGTPEEVFSEVDEARAQNRAHYGALGVERLKESIDDRQKLPGAAKIACAYKSAARQELVNINGTRRFVDRNPACKSLSTFNSTVLVAFYAAQRRDLPKLMGMTTCFWISGIEPSGVVLPVPMKHLRTRGEREFETDLIPLESIGNFEWANGPDYGWPSSFNHYGTIDIDDA